LIKILFPEQVKEKGKKSNLPKLCLRCKIALQEVIKSVWKCPMCKTIINDRLKDLPWEKPNKNNDLGKNNG